MIITNREEVIDKAFGVFVRMNYEKASIITLAKACGVTKTGIVYYFPHKLDLFMAVADKYVLQMHEPENKFAAPADTSQCNKRYNKAIEMMLNKGRIERMIEENEEAYTDWKLDKEWKMLKKSPEKQSGDIESGNKSAKYFQENQKVKAFSNADRIDRRKKKGMKTQRT